MCGEVFVYLKIKSRIRYLAISLLFVKIGTPNNDGTTFVNRLNDNIIAIAKVMDSWPFFFIEIGKTKFALKIDIGDVMATLVDKEIKKSELSIWSNPVTFTRIKKLNDVAIGSDIWRVVKKGFEMSATKKVFCVFLSLKFVGLLRDRHEIQAFAKNKHFIFREGGFYINTDAAFHLWHLSK